MKAVILAAGQGTRLRPVTLTMPKPLVPVANKHLLDYAIDKLKAAGFNEIGIVVNNLESPIVETLGDGAGRDVAISYITQEEQLGLAHAIGLARDFVGDEAFAVLLGDNILQDKMTTFFTSFAASDAAAAIALGRVADPQRFGIAEIQEGRIVRVVEKPKDPPSNLAIPGVYLFRRSIFDAIDQIEPSWRNEYEITDAIQVLIAKGETVQPYELDGWWIDAGKPDAIVTANQLVLEELPYSPPPPDDHPQIEGDCDISHRVVIGENTRIIDSVIRGPVIIGDNTIIRNSYVGPYSAIGNDTTLEDSEIEASIVMNNCVIRGVPGRIDRSLLAHNTNVTVTPRKPDAFRFVLAENTYVQL